MAMFPININFKGKVEESNWDINHEYTHFMPIYLINIKDVLLDGLHFEMRVTLVESLGQQRFIFHLLGTMSENFMAIHPPIIEIFQSGLKW